MAATPHKAQITVQMGEHPVVQGDSGVGIYIYQGSPEAKVAAFQGSLCMTVSVDCSSGTLYQKMTGSGNTGWVAL